MFKQDLLRSCLLSNYYYHSRYCHYCGGWLDILYMSRAENSSLFSWYQTHKNEGVSPQATYTEQGMPQDSNAIIPTNQQK